MIQTYSDLLATTLFGANRVTDNESKQLTEKWQQTTGRELELELAKAGWMTNFFSRAVDQIMGPIIWFDPPDPELSANHKQQKAGRRVGVNKTGPIRAAAPPEPEFVRQKQPEQEEPNHWFRLEGKIVLLFRGKPPKCLTGWVGLINPSRSL